MTAGQVMAYKTCAVAGLVEAVGVSAVVFVAFYPFYLMGALGAGDVKLFMMMGCYCPYMGTDILIH